MTKRQIKAVLRKAAHLFGIPKEWLWAMAQIESNFRPDARNLESGASGLFQFLHTTAGEENIDPFDVVEASAAAAKRIRRARAVLVKAGIQDSALTDVYLCHQQGLKGYLEIHNLLVGVVAEPLSESRIRNMGSNLPATAKIEFSKALSHREKVKVFLDFWEARMERALAEASA